MHLSQLGRNTFCPIRVSGNLRVLLGVQSEQREKRHTSHTRRTSSLSVLVSIFPVVSLPELFATPLSGQSRRHCVSAGNRECRKGKIVIRSGGQSKLRRRREVPAPWSTGSNRVSHVCRKRESSMTDPLTWPVLVVPRFKDAPSIADFVNGAHEVAQPDSATFRGPEVPAECHHHVNCLVRLVSMEEVKEARRRHQNLAIPSLWASQIFHVHVLDERRVHLCCLAECDAVCFAVSVTQPSSLDTASQSGLRRSLVPPGCCRVRALSDRPAPGAL